MDAIQEAVKKHGITEGFNFRAGGEESEGFPAETTRHAYPIVEGVRGLRGVIKNCNCSCQRSCSTR